MEAVNSWAACTDTGAGTYPILVRYADTPEEKNRSAVPMPMYTLILITACLAAKKESLQQVPPIFSKVSLYGLQK